MDAFLGIAIGFLLWFVVRYGLMGFYTVNQDQRAVKTIFGRAERADGTSLDLPEAQLLGQEKRQRYNYPQLRVTDHRIGLTIYRLFDVLNGDLDEIIDALIAADRAEKL